MQQLEREEALLGLVLLFRLDKKHIIIAGELHDTLSIVFIHLHAVLLERCKCDRTSKQTSHKTKKRFHKYYLHKLMWTYVHNRNCLFCVPQSLRDRRKEALLGPLLPFEQCVENRDTHD
nr:MAG TPA: hypothetical protein [Caudoviricetes sp.]